LPETGAAVAGAAVAGAAVAGAAVAGAAVAGAAVAGATVAGAAVVATGACAQPTIIITTIQIIKILRTNLGAFIRHFLSSFLGFSRFFCGNNMVYQVTSGRHLSPIFRATSFALFIVCSPLLFRFCEI
jgi:hypothetical protein